jgi:small subunit ribosomal protein S1
MVLSISKEKKKLQLGLKQLQENPWETTIPSKYAEGTMVTGKVTKVVSFGVFVELERDLEGLIHSSRMGKKDAALATGDIVEGRVEKLDLKEGKIGLGLSRVIEKAKPGEAVAAAPTLEPGPEDAQAAAAEAEASEPQG